MAAFVFCSLDNHCLFLAALKNLGTLCTFTEIILNCVSRKHSYWLCCMVLRFSQVQQHPAACLDQSIQTLKTIRYFFQGTIVMWYYNSKHNGLVLLPLHGPLHHCSVSHDIDRCLSLDITNDYPLPLKD